MIFGSECASASTFEITAVQGYLAHKKQPPPRTLQQDCTQGAMVVLWGGHRCSSQFKNNYFAEMWSGSEEGSYLRLIDFCITQL